MAKLFQKKKRKKIERMGSTQRKILLLLFGGLALSLAVSPIGYFRVIGIIAKEWKAINRDQLLQSIKRLYKSKMVDLRDKEDGTQIMILSEKGKERVLKYKLDELAIPTPKFWDGKFRFVCFDIPEDQREARDALRETLQRLGFYKVQKSVFVYPYECKNEIDFVIELFGIRSYVRYGTIDSIDIDLHLRTFFKLT